MSAIKRLPALISAVETAQQKKPKWVRIAQIAFGLTCVLCALFLLRYHYISDFQMIYLIVVFSFGTAALIGGIARGIGANQPIRSSAASSPHWNRKVRRALTWGMWALIVCLATGSAVLEAVAFLFDDNGTPLLTIVANFLKWQLGLVGVAVACHLLINRKAIK